MKYTQGPWRVEYLGGSEECGPDMVQIIAEDGTIITEMDFRDNQDCHNFELMASAPELLEACQSSLTELKLFCKACGDNCDECETNKVIQQLTAVIAKTEGRDLHEP